MFAFLASSHIERTEDDENTTFDGTNMYTFGVFVAVIISLETYLVCNFTWTVLYSNISFFIHRIEMKNHTSIINGLSINIMRLIRH